jgi:hypothetical protein
MGTFVACVQVYLGDKQPTDTRTLVIETLRQLAPLGPFVETTQDNDEDPDREIFVGPLGDVPWLTILDTQGALHESARRISAVIDGTAVSINLIDSDVLHLRRFSQGRVVDDYCSDLDSYAAHMDEPHLDELRAARKEAGSSGDVTKWRDLMVDRAGVDELREAWGSNPVFADDILLATADALAMNKEEIWPGPLAETFTRLTFRTTEPRLYETRTGGLPRLSLAGYGEIGTVYAGETLSILVYVQNNGGPATGLDIVAWGSALDARLVVLETVAIRSVNRPMDIDLMEFSAYERRDGDEKKRVSKATFPALQLPGGIAGGPWAVSQLNVSWQKAYAAICQAQCHVQISGSIEPTGSGELFIAFRPHTNRRRGQAIYHTLLEVLPAPRRPLRYSEARRPARYSELHRLEKPDCLFALVSFGVDQEQSSGVVADAIEAWVVEVAAKDADRFTIHLQTRPDLRPRAERLQAREIPGSDRWAELRGALKHCASFSIKRRSAAILFDASKMHYQACQEAPAPHLAFWYFAERLDETELEKAQRWLVGMVDSLMRRLAGLQALAGRWAWWNAIYLDSTPYEVACSLGGQCTTALFWCKKYLRGVTERVWLGPALLARLSGADLKTVAVVTQVGDGVRVELREDATLDRLEEVLAPLLPNENDWRVGMERLYPRE